MMTHIFRHVGGAWITAAIGICLSPSTLAVLHAEPTAPSAAVRNAETPTIAACVDRVEESKVAGTTEAAFAQADHYAVFPTTADGAPDLRCERQPELFRRVVGRVNEIYKLDATKLELFARIKRAACHFGVDPAIGKGIAWTESRFNQNARSPDGLSYGAFQLTRVTAEVMRARLAETSIGLPLHDEVTLGIGYLRYLDRLFARRTVLDNAGRTTTPVTDPVERWRFAIAAYNAGEGRVAGAQRQAAALGRNPTRFDDVRPLLPPITRRYVDTVITFGATQATVHADASVMSDAVTS